MTVIWHSTEGFISTDSSLTIKHLSDIDTTIVTCETHVPAPKKGRWISMDLDLPKGALFSSVLIRYELTTAENFISKIRLYAANRRVELPVQPHKVSGIQLHDDKTKLKNTYISSYRSEIDAPIVRKKGV